MHRYYQKNLKKWHKTLNSYMNYISYELESLTGQSYDTPFKKFGQTIRMRC